MSVKIVVNLRAPFLTSALRYSHQFAEKFDLLAQEEVAVSERLRRKKHNENPPLNRLEFEAEALGHSKDDRINRLLTILKVSGLKEYTLHQGRASYTLYEGADLMNETERHSIVFEFRSVKSGLSLQFDFAESDGNSDFLIHVLLLKRETNRQGSFFAIKRMIVAELWQRVFVPAGAGCLYGRAVWSSNSEIRNSGQGDDWRKRSCYVGVNRQLKSIRINGLTLFYLRMGFLPFELIVPNTPPEFVCLIAPALEERIKKSMSADDWLEAIKYQRSEQERWRSIQDERQSLLSQARSQELASANAI